MKVSPALAEFEVYFDSSAFDKAVNHFKRGAEEGVEAMGLLVGGVFEEDGGGFVMVSEYVTAENEAGAYSVKFREKAFSDLASQLDGKLVVGWAHSHPGFGCYLSSIDVATQKACFSEPFHVALVVDPKSGNSRVFKVEGEKYREASFAVVKTKNV